MTRRLFVSFSGGQTSAFMSWACLNMDQVRSRYDEMRFLFANTGQEHERTLEFVDRCDREFGLNVEWVEAEVHQHEKRAPSARLVTFETASRDGRPFEDVIRKYGIPNAAFPSCTRDLKLAPMIDRLRSTGWPKGTYDTAIGIRIDEVDRMSAYAAKNRIVYPLISWIPTRKSDIASWWRKQKFHLGLEERDGNCRWCWKKSFSKHLQIIAENQVVYDFPRRMEATYGHVGAEFDGRRLPDGYSRVFFRGNRSTDDLFRMRGTGSVQLDLFQSNGCEESCEVYGESHDICGSEIEGEVE